MKPAGFKNIAGENTRFHFTRYWCAVPVFFRHFASLHVLPCWILPGSPSPKFGTTWLTRPKAILDWCRPRKPTWQWTKTTMKPWMKNNESMYLLCKKMGDFPASHVSLLEGIQVSNLYITGVSEKMFLVYIVCVVTTWWVMNFAM